MDNLEYYGFSLLCRVQQSCNSRFKSAPDFFDLGSNSILDFSGLSSGVCSAEVAERDLVGRLFGGKLTQEVLDCLCEACLEAGIAARLYQLSQWTPDRKRSTLIMYEGGRRGSGSEGANAGRRGDGRGSKRRRVSKKFLSKKWLAVSIGDRESSRVLAYGGLDRLQSLQASSKVEHIISDHEIWFSSLECREICESFMDLARERDLFKT